MAPSSRPPRSSSPHSSRRSPARPAPGGGEGHGRGDRGGERRGGRRGDRGAGLSASADGAPAGKVRLQRFLADAGVASRRECEKLIESGFVEVNGEVPTRLPVFVDPARDRIKVNGAIVEARHARAERVYLAVYKPDNTLTTTRDVVEDESNTRRTVLDLVDHPAKSRLIVVGRLGFHATGLVLLTNDGELAHRLSHAKFGVTKTYRIEVRGRLHREALASLRDRFCPRAAPAPEAEGADAPGPLEPLRIVRESPGGTTLELVMRAGAGADPRRISEPGVAAPDPDDPGPMSQRERLGRLKGTFRGRGAAQPPDSAAEEDVQELSGPAASGGELARMLLRMGNPVRRLERIAIGPLELRFLRPGDVRRLTKEEVESLRVAAGLSRPASGAAPASKPPRTGAQRGGSGRADRQRGADERRPRGRPPKPQARGGGAGRSRPARPSQHDDIEEF